MRTIEKMQRAFKIYTDLNRRANQFLLYRPQGWRGIACGSDHNAKQWQKLQFRLNFLECYLKGEQINWYHADWLSLDEMKRRTAEQRLNQKGEANEKDSDK